MCKLGTSDLARFCIAATVVWMGALVSLAAADPTPVEVYSQVVAMDLDPAGQVGSLLPSDFVEQLNTQEPEPVNDGLKIAEPGTLGLMALAGLMGGAMAMRRRLG
jgi:hypothetical protein